MVLQKVAQRKVPQKSVGVCDIIGHTGHKDMIRARDPSISTSSTIIQVMRFSCTACAVVGLLVIGLRDCLQISKGCVFFCTICALVGRLVVGLSYLVRLQ